MKNCAMISHILWINEEELRLNDQDRRAVENMCLTGMELDGLYACFPAFPKDEIEKIYNEVKNQPEDGAEDNVISVNCS